MHTEPSLFAFIKGLLTKACFTVGLCTTAYFSVEQLHQHFHPEAQVAAPSSNESVFRTKLDALNQNQPMGSVPRFVRSRRPVHVQAQAQAIEIPSPTPQASTAAASPSASPESDPNQNPNQTPENLPAAQAINPTGYPNYYAPSGYASGQESAANPSAPVAHSAFSTDAAANALGNQTGQMMLNAPASLGGGTSYAGGGSAAGVPGAPTSTSSNLTSQDITLLTSVVIHASIPTQQFSVTGRNSDGTPLSAYTVSSTRWNTNEGVLNSASFSFIPGSTGYPVQANVSFQVESANQVPLPVAMSLKPSHANGTDTVSNGKALRIYTFNFTDQSVLNNSDNLHSVTATVTFDISNPSSPVFQGGTFTFNRSEVKTDNTAWDPSRSPASSSSNWVWVDQLPFSMTLAK